MSRITVAESAGFCFGVNRSVELVEKAVSEGKTPVTYGPIIHNRHVVQHFEQQGVRVVESAEEVQPEEVVIIRSHGVPKAVMDALVARGAQIVDATCPFVKRIHGIVRKAEEEGRLPIIIGTRSHPEVEGISGWCSRCLVFETPEELDNWIQREEENQHLPVCMVCQTTSTENLWKNCVQIAKKQLSNLKIFDTICKATETRQNEAAALSRKSDAMIVVGDPKSSNTGKLAQICRENCGRVALVDNGAMLEPEFFCGRS